MFHVLNTAKSLRDDLIVVFIFHEDTEVVDGAILNRKIKTIGKMIDEKWEPKAMFTVLFWTRIESDENGVPKYEFITNQLGSYPAKTPMDMFKTPTIPNDLQKALEKMRSYYGEENTKKKAA